MKRIFLSGLLVLLTSACGDLKNGESEKSDLKKACSDEFTQDHKNIVTKMDLLKNYRERLVSETTYSVGERETYFQAEETIHGSIEDQITRFERRHSDEACLLHNTPVNKTKLVEEWRGESAKMRDMKNT